MGWITLERGNRTDGDGWVVVVRMTGLKWGRMTGLREGKGEGQLILKTK